MIRNCGNSYGAILWEIQHQNSPENQETNLKNHLKKKKTKN
jgi:hypothetical protein